MIELHNLFRYIGDALMVSSRTVLIRKIEETKSVSGLSLQTQILYMITYLFRYLDLLHFEIGQTGKAKRIYNGIMKVVFLSYQVYILYLILAKYKHTYNKKYDNFNMWFLLGISAVISPFVMGDYGRGLCNLVEEYLYTNSLIIESVAILPQLVMIQEAGDCETMTSLYILLLGLYRLCYVIYFSLNKASGADVDYLMIVTGVVQFGLYIDFFIMYYKYVMGNVESGFRVSNKVAL